MKSSKYSDIDSPYIRERLANTRFEDRAIINDLVRLYWWVRGQPTAAASARAYSMLRERLHDDWVALFKEYSEKAYEKWVNACDSAARKEQEDFERGEARRKADQQTELDDWVRAGGLPPESGPRR